LLKCWSRNGKGDAGRAQRGKDAGKSRLTFRAGPCCRLLWAPAQRRSCPGSQRPGRAAASKRTGCWGPAERVAETFAVKIPVSGYREKKWRGRCAYAPAEFASYGGNSVAFRARHWLGCAEHCASRNITPAGHHGRTLALPKPRLNASVSHPPVPTLLPALAV